jgi:hypothetical protein
LNLSALGELSSAVSLSSGPAGASFDPGTGRVLWVPSADQAGTASFRFLVPGDEGTYITSLDLEVYPAGSDLLPARFLPDAPSVADVTTTSCTLAWSPSTDPDGAARYEVIAQEDAPGAVPAIVADTGGPLTTSSVASLAPDTAYRIWVVEIDAAGDAPPNGASPAALVTTLPAAPAAFIRGDPTGDGKVDLSDAVLVLSYLYTGGAEPGCLASADANGSDAVDLADAVFLLGFLFQAGAPPPSPYPVCGGDPGAGSLDCASDPACR